MWKRWGKISMVLAVVAIIFLSLTFSLPATEAKKHGTPNPNMLWVGAESFGYSHGIAGDVYTSHNSVPAVTGYGYHVANQIHVWFEDDPIPHNSWAQIGFVRGADLDPYMNLHLYIECMFAPTQYSFTPYYDPGALLEIVQMDTWVPIEIIANYNFGYDAVSFYADSVLRKTLHLGYYMPNFKDFYGAAELTCTMGTLWGDWENMKYIKRMGPGGSQYIYFDWESSSPFREYSWVEYPFFHCEIDTYNSFHNEQGYN